MEIFRTKLLKPAIFLSLLIFALSERLFFDLGPNIELITTTMLISGAYLSKKHALLLTFLVLLISDTFLKTTNIFMFTWTGFLIPAIIIKYSHKTKNATISGISTNIFFFIWTNFGVWLLDSWSMYPNNLQGLLMSYTNALPFLKLNLLSTLIFVPSSFFVLNTILSKVPLLHPNPASPSYSS